MNGVHTLLCGVITSQRARRLGRRIAVICCSRRLVIGQEFSCCWTVILGEAYLSLLRGPCFQSEETSGPCQVASPRYLLVRNDSTQVACTAPQEIQQAQRAGRRKDE